MAQKFVRLKTLAFHNHRLASAQFPTDFIGNLPNLSSLTIRSSPLNSDEVRSLAASLKRIGRSLRTLDLTDNQDIGRKGHLPLAEVIMSGHLVHLEFLNLSLTGMDRASYVAYAMAVNLGRLQALKDLDFSRSECGPDGHMDLAKALESGQLPCLKSLFLSSTGIDGASSKSYCKAFTSGHVRALRDIDFSDNVEIGSEGHMSLAKALESGQLPCLASFYLAGTSMDSACCSAYCKAFVSGRVPALLDLTFADNEIGDEAMESIVECMKAGLVRLDLSGNQFSQGGYDLWGSALASGAANSLQTLTIGKSVISRENVFPILEAFSLNKFLVVKVDWTCCDYPDLELQMKEFRDRNERQVQIRKDLGGTGISEVEATHGKVYLCGSPMAGKTTLRKTMQRSFGRALCMSETRSSHEERTRGIEVSQLKCPGKEDLMLALWDMAGQEEYHLVHHVFLRDLGSGDGSATTFVIVCRSEGSSTTPVIVRELEYWLRFIASSSNRDIGSPRDVFVVLNCIDGDSSIIEDTSWWKGHLADRREKYKGLLAIRNEVFMADLRKRRCVLGLKQSLIDHHVKTLHGKTVPTTCQMIQDKLILWSKEREQFPVLHWINFFEKVQKLDPSWLGMTIEAATRYLHEVGVLIYISKKSLVDLHVEHAGKGLVILNPTWMCREVVGKIILPEVMKGAGEQCLRDEVDQNNGSISTGGLQKFIRSKHGEWKTVDLDDLIVILLSLGLCFERNEKDKLFIPCLIKEDGHQSRGECWEADHVASKHTERQWVMGYTVEYERSDIVLAPIALWHNFQVDVAQFVECNNSSFKVGKSFMSFRYHGMAVLIEVILEKADNPTFESIDVLVKPLDAVAKTTRRAQLDLAHDLTDRLLRLWIRVCPAVHYVQRVVWPWPALQHKPKIRNSEVQMFLQDKSSQINEVRKRVQEHGVGENLDLRVGDFGIITYDELLSSKLLGDAAKSVQDQVKSLENQAEKGLLIWSAGIQEAIKEGLYPPDFLEQERIAKDKASSSTSQDLGAMPRTQLTKGPDQFVLNSRDPSLQDIFKICKEIFYQNEHILKGNREILQGVKDIKSELQDLHKDLKEVKDKQKLMLERIQDFQSIFLEDKEQSCPRFIYLVAKDAGKAARWTSLKRAMALSVKVHVRFVCEAQYDIHGQHGLHSVKNQQGIDVSTMKDWARKLAPWLKVSLTVVSITAKVAANIVAPGVGSILANAGDIFPDLLQTQRSSLADLLLDAIGCSQEELDQQINKGETPSSTSTLETPQKLCRSSREYMTALLAGLSVRDFQEKVALRKVSLQHKRISDASVLWICDECYKKYENSENTTIHELNRMGNR